MATVGPMGTPTPNARPAVVLKQLDAAGEPRDVAHIGLDDEQRVVCDHAELMGKWQMQGIVGRADHGRVFPVDGQRFVEELPYTYKSPYCWAEPTP